MGLLLLPINSVSFSLLLTLPPFGACTNNTVHHVDLPRRSNVFTYCHPSTKLRKPLVECYDCGSARSRLSSVIFLGSAYNSHSHKEWSTPAGFTPRIRCRIYTFMRFKREVYQTSYSNCLQQGALSAKQKSTALYKTNLTQQVKKDHYKICNGHDCT